MPFTSVLFSRAVEPGERPEPPFFPDLNLDQVFRQVTAGREQYDLALFFRIPLRDAAAVEYRHEVLRDLEGDATSKAVAEFAQRMRTVRENLAQARKLRYRYQKESWFLGAARGYCAAVRALAHVLGGADLGSRGFTAFREYLCDYAGSAAFGALTAEADEVARAAAFLVSPASSGINAQQIIVDAGMSVNYFDRDLIRRAMRPDDPQP